MPQFTVQVRAIRHLTAEIKVEADSEQAARIYAEKCIRKSDFLWSESDPEDAQTESVRLGD